MSQGQNILSRLSQRLPKIMEEALSQALDHGIRIARRRMEQGDGPRIRSGKLYASLRKRVTRQGGSLVGEIYSIAPYALAQENGAVIQANKAKYLKFQVQDRWVSVRRVVLPARPYLRPGRDAALEVLDTLIFQAIQKELS